MYNSFFGFKERPFQLVPNPAYLFLSKGHEESLAHLVYAIDHGDGFVAITGEVGTGKTTLCRFFLDGLEISTEAAYIFNPKLDAIQLLKAINDEFGIDSTGETSKELIDTLNRFLIARKAAGGKVLLLIDEAQNLSFEVLEQLRLLSNLETNTAKLLQIILVGQPELADKLDSHELRQLDQRITLRSNLPPMNFKETKAYILHRLHIGSHNPSIRFTDSALRSIYSYSQGIPRLINICCDRALLTAFGNGHHRITLKTAHTAIRELKSRDNNSRPFITRPWRRTLLLGLSCLALVLLVFTQPNWLNDRINRPETPAAPLSQDLAVAPDPSENFPFPFTAEENPRRTEEGRLVIPQTYQSSPDLGNLLDSVTSLSSRHSAMKAVLAQWRQDTTSSDALDFIADNETFFRLSAKQNGMNVYQVKGGLDEIEKFNLPAILTVYPPGDHLPRYLALCELEGMKIRLQLGTHKIELPRTALDPYWDGTAMVLWRNFTGLNGILPLNSSADSVLSLKMLVRELGFGDLTMNPVYDEPTRMAVTAIQQRHGLEADGLVGPATKIAIYNEDRALAIPHIIQQQEKAMTDDAGDQGLPQLNRSEGTPEPTENPEQFGKSTKSRTKES